MLMFRFPHLFFYLKSFNHRACMTYSQIHSPYGYED